MSYTRFLAFVAILMLAVALPALAKPNFSGEWKLNISKSDFGPMPAPTSRVDTITHEDPKLKVATKQSSERGDFTSELNFTTDGKECVNDLRGNPMKSTLKWDGDTLILEGKGKFGENEFTMQGKWTLSEDGKTLTVKQHFASTMGEADSKLVFEKQ
jgi:hypothetical protein